MKAWPTWEATSLRSLPIAAVEWSKAAKPKHSFGGTRSSPVCSPIFPVLVDWSPAALSLVENPEVQKAETHFSNIGRYFGTDLGGGGTWKPTDAQIEELKFAIRYGKPENVFDALLTSSERSREPFSGSGGDSFAVNNSLVAAIDQWQAACDQNDVRKERDAWSALRRAGRHRRVNQSCNPNEPRDLGPTSFETTCLCWRKLSDVFFAEERRYSAAF